MTGSDKSLSGSGSPCAVPKNGFSAEPTHGNHLSHRRRGSTRPGLCDFKAPVILSRNQQNQQTETGQDGRVQATNKPAPNSTDLLVSSLTSLGIASMHISQSATSSIPLLTPPEDQEAWKWTLSSLPAHNSNTTIPPDDLVVPSGLLLTAPPIAPISSLSSSMAHVTDQDLSAGGLPVESSAASLVGTHHHLPRITTANASSDSPGTYSWVEEFVGVAVKIDPSDPSSKALQLVSQTLPGPAKENSTPNALYANVIATIQSIFEPARQPYITITHAVPPHFDLLLLPGSPPATPNLPTGREDYFTQSIFAHAAVVPPHHMNELLTMMAPCSPNPIVPPSSVQISVLERYIPPLSSRECEELFSLTGQSPLVDRLQELSPDNGSMLFVYPTKTGGNTFLSEYLSPILGRLLRSLIEMHQLSYNLAESLSSMAAVADMDEFVTLKARISALCHRMSAQNSSTGRPSHFHLVYADKGHVTMDRQTWTEWYLKQEHARFKRTLDAYWGQGRRLSQVESATAGSVLRQFIDGVKTMKPGEAEQTGAGVEIAVFVIRRSPIISAS